MHPKGMNIGVLLINSDTNAKCHIHVMHIPLLMTHQLIFSLFIVLRFSREIQTARPWFTTV